MLKKDFQIENRFYENEAILSAIDDFEGFPITYKDSILEISGGTDEEVDRIFDEFMNYTLGLQNEKI